MLPIWGANLNAAIITRNDCARGKWLARLGQFPCAFVTQIPGVKHARSIARQREITTATATRGIIPHPSTNQGGMPERRL